MTRGWLWKRRGEEKRGTGGQSRYRFVRRKSRGVGLKFCDCSARGFGGQFEGAPHYEKSRRFCNCSLRRRCLSCGLRERCRGRKSLIQGGCRALSKLRQDIQRSGF
jgi:hypothetical protein